ncbi:MAG: RNA polymerase factor sigma-32 [Myxococcota bacterium]
MPDPKDEDGAIEAEVVDDVDADGQDDAEDVGIKSAGKGAKLVKTGATRPSKRDPLAAYMKDVSRYPLLSREEEHALAVKLVENGDLDAARKLVLSNLRLVVKIAYDYRQAYKNLLDLVQEGNIGLMQAVKKYDPYKGVKLSSYAAWWIRAYILRYILNNYRLVKLGTTQAQRKLFFNLQKEKSKLAAMGIEPTPEKIAEKLSVPVKDVISMDRRLSAGEASLDVPVGMKDGGRPVARVELIDGGSARIDDVLAEQELGDRLKDKIHEYGKTLEGKEKTIFEERLLSEDPKTLQQLGDGFGVSRERVRQIEKRLLQKMKKYLKDELGEAVLDVYEA